ncbi:MAG: hypothetical protein AB7S48_11205 [Bacteroidales bacterium]
MRKSTLLKMAFVFSTLFMFAETNAQILVNYSETNAVDMYQTVNTNFRLYVKPDLVYSPTYDAATNGNVNTGSYWMFVISGGLTAVNPASLATAVNQNWVELTAATVGAQTVTAAEQWGAAGCADGTPESLNVNVVAAPIAQISTADPAVRCTDAVGLGADAVTIAITEDVPATLANYAFAVTETVVNWDDISGTNPTAVSNNATFVNNTIGAKAAATEVAQPSYTISFNTSNLAIQNAKVTVYTYTLVKATDAPGAAANGIVSTVSHKSNYLAGVVSTYPFDTKTTYQVIVAPTPTTGPIYHIPNNFTF